MRRYHGYLAIQGGATIAFPRELRRKYHLDKAGAQVEMTERDDGVIELRPTLPVPVDEMWFWASESQQAEREAEAEADLSSGRYRDFASAESFIADLTTMHSTDGQSAIEGPAS